jgi:uncharacterized protein (TIGR02246 family)
VNRIAVAWRVVGPGAAALAGLLAACAPAPSAETDVAAIEALNERLLGALNDGDWQRLNELTDDDYVAIINGAAIAGRERLETSNRSFLEQWENDEAWLPNETVIDGDLAFQRGAFTMTLTPRAGGEARALAGTYLHIYQRRPDGDWALTRAMAESID